MQAANCYRCVPSGMLGAVQVDLLCRWANTPVTPTGCTDPIEEAWFQRIVLGGALEPSPAQRTAVCEFCRALRLAAIEDMFYALNVVLPLGPGDMTTMSYPLIFDAGAGAISPWTNVNFGDAELDNNGLHGQPASSTYMDVGGIGMPGGSVDQFDYGLTCQQSELRTDGELDSTTLGFWNQFDVDCRFSLTTWEAALGGGPKAYIVDPNNPALVAQAETVAFYSASRSAVDLLEFWWGRTGPGLLLLDTDVTDVSAITVEWIATYFMALQYQDIFGVSDARYHTSKRISFAAAHKAFDAWQTEQLFNAVQALRLDFGGGDV